MAVVRLEIDVPDDSADGLANELHSRYVRVSALPDGWRSAAVRVFPDAEIQQERAILRVVSQALAWFLPGR